MGEEGYADYIPRNPAVPSVGHRQQGASVYENNTVITTPTYFDIQYQPEKKKTRKWKTHVRIFLISIFCLIVICSIVLSAFAVYRLREIDKELQSLYTDTEQLMSDRERYDETLAQHEQRLQRHQGNTEALSNKIDSLSINYNNFQRKTKDEIVAIQNNYPQVRLRDGSPSSGRVEILYNGTWGTVCDNQWDNNDATVVCRMLGFSQGFSRCCSFYGKGNGPIWLSGLECDGSEDNIALCANRVWGGHHVCTHGEDAGVLCQNDAVVTLGPPTTVGPLATLGPLTATPVQLGSVS